MLPGPPVEGLHFLRRGAVGQPMPGSQRHVEDHHAAAMALHQAHQVGKDGAVPVRDEAVGAQGVGRAHLLEDLIRDRCALDIQADTVVAPPGHGQAIVLVS